MIIDSLPHEQIWRAWIAGPGSEDVDVRVWIHAKAPESVTSEWVRSRLLPHSHRPRWGSIEITRAMIDLLEEAVSDPEVGRIIYASESCIPLAPLAEAGFELWREENSWLNYHLEPTNGYDTLQKWGKMSVVIPKDTIAKADQWLCLARAHAEDIIRLPLEAQQDLWPLMKSVTASDEMYIATMLRILGELPGGSSSSSDAAADGAAAAADTHIVKRRMTWCNWAESSKSPLILTSFDPAGDSVTAATAERCIFGRKFAKDAVPLEAWQIYQEARLKDFETAMAAMDPAEKEKVLAFIAAGEKP
ncbi:hypothetical protein JKP88DRAFT_188305, partial [Tribonema minus]